MSITKKQRDEMLEKLIPSGDGQKDDARLREVVVELVTNIGPSAHSDAVDRARQSAPFSDSEAARFEREGVTGKPGDGVAEKAASLGEGNSAIPGAGRASEHPDKEVRDQAKEAAKTGKDPARVNPGHHHERAADTMALREDRERRENRGGSK